MKQTSKNILKSFSFSAGANIVSMIVSALVVLIVPKSISTEGYGYYQLYILYIGYAGFFQFGIIDGVYLRYGGAYYNELDKPKMYSQFCILWILQLIEFVIVSILALSLESGPRLFVIISFGVEMILANTRGMLTYVLQATNRIKEGAISNTIGRLVFFCLAMISLICGLKRFETIIVADIIGRVTALIYSSIKCKEIVFRHFHDFKWDLTETKDNISVGFMLMLSSICSLLIMGILRFAIENKWGIVTFGKVSLTLSISNLVVTFINAATLVLFPALRRAENKTLTVFYKSVKVSLIPLTYCFLIFYYPVSRLLLMWLPKYAEGLRYMAILFPLCIYEGRMSLLNNTYLKTTSDVKQILKINLSSVGVSVLLTALSVYLIQNLELSVLSILLAVMFRCLHADFAVGKKIDLKVLTPTILELVLMASFILLSWYVDSALSTLGYCACLTLYFAINKKRIINGLKELRAIV